MTYEKQGNEYSFFAGTPFIDATWIMYKAALKGDGEELKTTFNGVEITMKNKYPKNIREVGGDER